MKVRECLLDFPSQWTPDEGFVQVVEVLTQGEDVDREGRTEGGKCQYEVDGGGLIDRTRC